MKSAHDEPVDGLGPDHLGEADLHFVRGLVGERDDPVRSLLISVL